MNNNPNYLKIGDKSANVIKLQKLLIKKGYQLKETGVFDPDTFRAVSDLQKSVGLDVDGIASKQVQNALEGFSVLTYNEPINKPNVQQDFLPYTENQYYKENYKKDKIIIQISNTNNMAYNYLGKLDHLRISNNDKAIGTSYIIGNDINLQIFEDESQANIIHTNQQNNFNLNTSSIGITLCNQGGLTISRRGIVNFNGDIVPDNEVFDLGRVQRGYRYFHLFTDKQLNMLSETIKYLSSKYSLKLSKGIYGQPTQFDINRDALNGKSGLWSLNNFNELSLLSPQPNLISVLNSI